MTTEIQTAVAPFRADDIPDILAAGRTRLLTDRQLFDQNLPASIKWLSCHVVVRPWCHGGSAPR